VRNQCLCRHPLAVMPTCSLSRRKSDKRRGRPLDQGKRLKKLSRRPQDPKVSLGNATRVKPLVRAKPKPPRRIARWHRHLVSRRQRWAGAGADPLADSFAIPRRTRPQAFLATDLNVRPAISSPGSSVAGQVEVTFEETRAHLGVETQRQWSDKAILRTTPGATQSVPSSPSGRTISPSLESSARTAAWYPKHS